MISQRSGNVTSGPVSNDEIRTSLRAQTAFFQRCYLAYINRSGTGAGSIVVAFTVSQAGKVRDAKILRTTFNDSTLNSCVLETVERTSFRAFEGDDVPVLEFPIELG
ncbi:MAG: TonB family protein [Bdellovibrionota bacterium]